MVIEPINGRSLEIRSSTNDFLKESVINVKLSTSNIEYDTYYRINYVDKISDNTYIISEFTRNDSCLWILPMIGGRENLSFAFKGNFISSYLDQIIKPEVYMTNRIALLYRFTPSASYATTKSNLISHKSCINAFKANDDRFDVFIFELDERYKEDYNRIVTGKYSEVSNDYKKDMLQFFKGDDSMKSVVKQQVLAVCNKSEQYRLKLCNEFSMDFPKECEYKGKIDLNKETLWL